jgi:hypothetical protein
MGCWSNGVEGGGVTDGDVVVRVLVEAPVLRVERVGAAEVAGVVVVVVVVDAAAVGGAAVRSVGPAMTAVELVTPPRSLVRGSAHTIPPPIARATRASGTIRRRSRDRDRASLPAWRR